MHCTPCMIHSVRPLQYNLRTLDNTHGIFEQYTLNTWNITHFTTCAANFCWYAAWTWFLTKYSECDIITYKRKYKEKKINTLIIKLHHNCISGRSKYLFGWRPCHPNNFFTLPLFSLPCCQKSILNGKNPSPFMPDNWP